MSFLRLGAMWALPLVILPILIHLIHRRRHRTMPWAAMMFLHRATESRRGPAKIRRWMVLAARTIVVAGLILALARPLSNGHFGWAASRIANPATTIVVLDRSPSMRTRLPDGRTRLETAKSAVVNSLKTLGVSTVVLVESVGARLMPAVPVDSLLSATITKPADSSASMPELFSKAIETIGNNDYPNVDVWVCSDRQSLDWQPDSAAWSAVSMQLRELDSEVRFYGVEFPANSQPNTSVAVTLQKVVVSEQGAELRLAVRVQCDDDLDRDVPVRLNAGGVTSTKEVSLVDGIGLVSQWAVPMVDDQVYGRVSIAADVNVADDQFFFAASSKSVGRVALIADESSDALEVAVSVFGGVSSVPDTFDGLDGVVCLGGMSEPSQRERMLEFVRQGGNLLCFPGARSTAETRGANTLLEDVRWDGWIDRPGSGASMGELDFLVDRFAPLSGDLVRVAETSDGQLLVGKRRVGAGSILFCGCDVANRDGAFVSDGVILYGLLSEIVDGHSRNGETLDRRVVGELAGDSSLLDEIGNQFELVKGFSSSTVERGHHAGVYRLNDQRLGSDLVAINGPIAETRSPAMPLEKLRELLPNANWTDIAAGDSNASSDPDLVQEIWGFVWIAVILAMLAEAWLSLPPRRWNAGPGQSPSHAPKAGSFG